MGIKTPARPGIIASDCSYTREPNAFANVVLPD
jgi:hypothetical protein